MTAAFKTTGVDVIERSKRGCAKAATAEKHMEAAMLRHRDANIGDVWQDNMDEGRWHWWVGYDWDIANAEREAAEKAVQS